MTEPTTTEPITVLLAEHEEARRTIARFEAALHDLHAGDGASLDRARTAAEEFLQFLDTGLERHIRKEEGPLFSRIATRLLTDDRLISEMVAEHDQIRLRREQLRAATEFLRDHAHDEIRATRERLRAAVEQAAMGTADLRLTGQVLLRTLRVHFQNEEELVFPLAGALLDPAERETAAHEMAAIDRETIPAPAAVLAPTIDLMTEAAALLASVQAQREGRTARTLLKDGLLRVVLVALPAGGRLSQHHAPGLLTLQGLQGVVEVRAGDQVCTLRTGALLTLPSRAPHEVTALQDSALLLTFVGDG